MRNFDRSQRLIRYRRSDRTTWPGMAFILESLLLLLFVSASLAVLMALFVQSNLLGEENIHRSEAIVAASNVAEMFAQDPASVASAFEQDGYDVTCETESEETDAGMLTLAHITVSLDDKVLYTLTTAAYQSNHISKGSVEAVEVAGSNPVGAVEASANQGQAVSADSDMLLEDNASQSSSRDANASAEAGASGEAIASEGELATGLVEEVIE